MAEMQPRMPASVPTASERSVSQASMSAWVANELMRATMEPTNGVEWSFII